MRRGSYFIKGAGRGAGMLKDKTGLKKMSMEPSDQVLPNPTCSKEILAW